MGGTVSFILDASMFFCEMNLITKNFLRINFRPQYTMLNPCRPGRVTTEASIHNGVKILRSPVLIDQKQYNRLFRDSTNVSLS